MKRKDDFKDWIIFEKPGMQGGWNWNEVAREHKTGINYQDNQSLAAIFHNGFRYYEMKADAYFDVHHCKPFGYFNKLKFHFRKAFPKKGRIDGINYFDDLLDLWLEKHKSRNRPPSKEEIAIDKMIKQKGFTPITFLNQPRLQHQAANFGIWFWSLCAILMICGHAKKCLLLQKWTCTKVQRCFWERIMKRHFWE